MSLKNKLSKRVTQNFIDKFQKSVPLSATIHNPNTPIAKIQDTERIKLKDFMNTIIHDETKPGLDFKADLEKVKSLTYVNEISKTPEKRDNKRKSFKQDEYFNRAEDINKKFEIQKIEGTKKSVRTGLLGYKVGMTAVWDKFGIIHPLTVIRVDNCQVVQVKTFEKDRCTALQLGMGHTEPERLNKPKIGHLIKNNIPPKKFLRQFSVTPENILPAGYMLSVRHFMPGQHVDIVATSKGKGFQGVMKRWNFKGLVATHGCSIKHRSAGSIGNREFPGKVWKGKKMAGQLGNERVTIQNLLVFRTDFKRNLIYVKGGIPGNMDGLVYIKDAYKKYEQWKKLSFPTFIPESGKTYPNILEYEGGEDMNEKYTHDNDEILGISEEEEEGEPEKNADDDTSIKK